MVLFCWTKVSFKVEIPFQGQKQNGCQIFQGLIWFFNKWKLGTNVIPHFQVILTGQLISCIICMILGHLQGQKVKYQGQLSKITAFNK